MNTLSRFRLSIIACAWLALWGANAQAADVPIRVLVLTGAGGNDWRDSSATLRSILERSGRFDVRVCESAIGLTAEAFQPFDVVVDHGAEITRDGDLAKALVSYVESGKGLVSTQRALNRGAVSDCSPISSPVAATGPAEFMQLAIQSPNHPIARGLSPSLRISDNLPRELKLTRAAESIISAQAESGSRVAVPAVAIANVGAGRTVAIALGYDIPAMHEAAYATLLTRSCEWAATGNVTLPAEPTLLAPAPDAVRALLITGGHPHEAAFYSIFDGYRDVDWINIETSAAAFQQDLRDKYDVIIMYDFSRELDEKCQQNLKDFIAADKGVVVLHHALLNYQQWSWWWEEVVGGRYRLSPEGDAPSSSYLQEQQFYVTPGEPHPVLDGVDPFHLVDEAYKNKWMSPRVRPLLTTDNPNSDPVLAWIGPCHTSRVVAIQLGHGHTAFGHPSYRRLVHNAILWADGRLK